MKTKHVPCVLNCPDCPGCQHCGAEANMYGLGCEGCDNCRIAEAVKRHATRLKIDDNNAAGIVAALVEVRT